MGLRENIRPDPFTDEVDPFDPKVLEAAACDFDSFMFDVNERFEDMHAKHGDATAPYTDVDFIDEAMEELLDAPIWLSFLYRRLRLLRDMVLGNMGAIRDEHTRDEQDSSGGCEAHGAGQSRRENQERAEAIEADARRHVAIPIEGRLGEGQGVSEEEAGSDNPDRAISWSRFQREIGNKCPQLRGIIDKLEEEDLGVSD
jgi:hypothetical protein